MNGARGAATAPAVNRYHRRRALTPRELLPAVGAAVGAAVGVGLATFYIARLFLEREPLPTAGEEEAGRAARPSAPARPRA